MLRQERWKYIYAWVSSIFEWDRSASRQDEIDAKPPSLRLNIA